MKKKFKTIMALMTVIAIAMSGMSIASATGKIEYSFVEESELQEAELQEAESQTEEPEITFTYSPAEENVVASEEDNMLTEGENTITVEWLDMSFVYNDQGWGSSFSGDNNRIRVINYTNTPIEVAYTVNIDTQTYSDLNSIGFRMTSEDKNGTVDSDLILNDENRQYAEAGQTVEAWLTVANTSPTITQEYDHVVIGSISVAVYPVTT